MRINEMNQDQCVAASERCCGCLRPKEACFCATIPSIDNQTDVLILQHRRERSHPFNTARIVHKSLRNSRLLVDHLNNLALRLRLKQRAGLLYPGPTAQLLSDLPPDQRPQQLVVVDGTWHQAKTVIREIPALRFLPQYRLAPTSPSRYHIRRAPSDTALSTLEATVAALQILEPRTGGLDQLLATFDTMVEGQLSYARSANNPRFRRRRNRTFKNIPLALLGDLRNIVVVYGEAPAGERGCKRMAGAPIYWVAQRMGTEETISFALTPPRPLDNTFLAHLELTRHDFAAAISLDEARLRWAEFRRSSDVVTAFHPGTARLFSYLDSAACLVLKSVDLASSRRHLALEDLLAARGIANSPAQLPGRAGKRLGNAIALVQHLNGLGTLGDNTHPLADAAT